MTIPVDALWSLEWWVGVQIEVRVLVSDLEWGSYFVLGSSSVIRCP